MTPKPQTTKTIEELVEQLGDICHEHYLGCTQTPDGYEYAYDNEVINLLSTPEATKAIEAYCLKEVLDMIGEQPLILGEKIGVTLSRATLILAAKERFK